jgi:hypothetical protein
MLAALVVVARPALSADDIATLDSWQSSFQQVWLSDSCVQEFQSWNKYWQGVHDFYFGARGSDGWFAESTAILAHVTDADAHAAVDAQLTTLTNCRPRSACINVLEQATQGGCERRLRKWSVGRSRH